MATGVDPYVYPGTNVLRNKADIRDADALKAFEYERSNLRAREIREQPLPERFDLAQLKKLHTQLFQDVYEWAGKTREIDIAKGGSMFAKPEYVESEAKRMSAELARENNLRNVEKAQFVERLAHHYGDWNALHPFREGNGRATREFLGQIARGAGYELDQMRIDNNKQQWNDAARDSMNGHMRPIEEILTYAVRPTRAHAFEHLPKDEALRKHPELADAFAGLDAIESALKKQFGDKPNAIENYTVRARETIVKQLDAGTVPKLAPVRQASIEPPTKTEPRR
jgi:cell filamentation protein